MPLRQFNRFDFSDESLVAFRLERTDQVEQRGQPNKLSVRRPSTVRSIDAACKI
jgi:hypothetical protein